MEHIDEHTTIIGTISGTLLSIILTFDFQDILKTIVLGAIGAAISFLVSKFLTWVWVVLSRKKRKE